MRPATLPASDDIGFDALFGKLLSEMFRFLFLSGHGLTLLALIALAAVAGLAMRRMAR